MKSFLRLLAAILALILLAAGVVFHLGGQQMEYRAETIINNTTVDDVMESLSQPEQWADGVISVESQPESNSEIGTKGTITLSQNGGSDQLETRLLSTSDSSLTVRTTGDSFDLFSIWKLDQNGKNVRVRQLMLANHRGLARFEALFNKTSAVQRMESELEQLRTFVEAGQTAPQTDSATESTTESENESENESAAGNDSSTDNESTPSPVSDAGDQLQNQD